VSADVVDFAVRLVRATRPHEDDAPQFVRDWVSWGAGPRASQFLVLGAKTRAILDGRYTPVIDDVKFVARAVLRHRIVTNFNAEAEGVDPVDIADRLVEHIGSAVRVGA
jgi:MoxR-like ATPase